jgi:hypothetical protein
MPAGDQLQHDSLRFKINRIAHCFIKFLVAFVIGILFVNRWVNVIRVLS